jgi:hypothetical protein
LIQNLIRNCIELLLVLFYFVTLEAEGAILTIALPSESSLKEQSIFQNDFGVLTVAQLKGVFMYLDEGFVRAAYAQEIYSSASVEIIQIAQGGLPFSGFFFLVFFFGFFGEIRVYYPLFFSNAGSIEFLSKKMFILLQVMKLVHWAKSPTNLSLFPGTQDVSDQFIEYFDSMLIHLMIFFSVSLRNAKTANMHNPFEFALPQGGTEQAELIAHSNNFLSNKDSTILVSSVFPPEWIDLVLKRMESSPKCKFNSAATFKEKEWAKLSQQNVVTEFFENARKDTKLAEFSSLTNTLEQGTSLQMRYF